MTRVLFVFAIAALQLCARQSYADVKLATPFRDGVVLQREKPVAVWGWADAGETVSVQFHGQIKHAQPDEHGRWYCRLDPLKASTEPERLVVAGKNIVTVNGVLVGDVWLCSGQSNMNLPLTATEGAKEEIAKANRPFIHYFDVKSSILEEPSDVADGEWQVCSPKTAGGFTAVGYYFAREIQPQLNIPIGIIKASLGGSPIEGWVSAKALASTSASGPAYKAWDRMSSGYIKRGEEYKLRLAAWKSREAAAMSSGQKFTEARPDRAWVDSDRNKPSGLYNGFIHPLEPFTLAGFLWYQGEGNVSRAMEYKVLFPIMIEQWRRDFQQPDLPFLFVQLPNFEPQNDPTGQSWAWLRDAQAAALKLPKVGMAVTLDIGDPAELHPGNKRDVGKRLALIALRLANNREVEDSGPTLSDIKREADSLRIRFTNSKGLALHGDSGSAFTLAGPNRKFVAAHARIDGETVVVSAAGITEPVAVRLNWENNPHGLLVNESGLPAAPFRSDDW